MLKIVSVRAARSKEYRQCVREEQHSCTNAQYLLLAAFRGLPDRLGSDKTAGVITPAGVFQLLGSNKGALYQGYEW